MKKLLLLLSILVTCCNLSSQIITNGHLEPETYVKNIFTGKGIVIGSINLIGAEFGFGEFIADSSIIGIKSGLILSTGCIDSINGPNKSAGYTSLKKMPTDKEELTVLRRGDRDLRRINRTKNSDISILEFEFIPIKNKLQFNYVFASEGYNEYVGTSFNDVFAFFLSGPGISKKKNLALLPDKETPVSINTINNRENSEYFRNNAAKSKKIKHKFELLVMNLFGETPDRLKKYNSNLLETIQFDGLTTVLKIEHNVIPFRKYKIKLAIGDGSNGSFDSAVFLEAGSFMSLEDSEGAYFKYIKENKDNSNRIDSILGISNGPEEDLLISESTLEPIPEVLEFSNIYFHHNSYKLENDFISRLDSLADYLLTADAVICTIIGHTDHHGSAAYNQVLSLRRATVVANYLISKGILKESIEVLGSHFSQTTSTTSKKEDSLNNRRVELILELVN